MTKTKRALPPPGPASRWREAAVVARLQSRPVERESAARARRLDTLPHGSRRLLTLDESISVER